MLPLTILPFLLLVVPVLEIATFILVGREIGVFPTLGLVVASAVVGALLLRSQGIRTLRRIQSEIGAGRVPARELLDGVAILAAGILLLTPGLLTDVVGYLLFVPGVRTVLGRFLARHVRVTATGAPARPGAGTSDGRPASGGVVDLGAEDFERRPDPSTPWNGSHNGNRTLH